MTAQITTRLKTTAAALGATALAACGGVLQLAEIEGSGYSDGSASGYGSVYVNGTQFATDTATIIVDGAPANEAALDVGMQLQIDGDVLGGVASRINFDRDLRGPVDAINRTNLLSPNARLTVLGQTVFVDSRTRYIGTELDSLSTDMSIAVSGLRGADGSLRATWVSLHNSLYVAGNERVDVEGVVTAVSGNRASLGGLQIDLGSTALAGQVAAGDRIEAAGLQVIRGGTLSADQAEFAPIARSAPGPQVQLDGLVAAVSGDVFRIGNLQIDGSQASRGDASALPITSGARVIVTGTQSGTDRVSASRIVLLPPADIWLTGTVAGIDLDSDQLSVLGQTLQLLPHTQFIDDSAAELRRFRTADLALGDSVQVLAYTTTNGALAVARLRRIDPIGNTTLRSHATNVDASNERLELARIRVGVTPTTVYTDADGNLETSSQFFAAISNGTLVEAVGDSNGLGGLTADRLTRP